MAWYRQVRAADWDTPADVKRAVGTPSILRDGRVEFNIAGNKYRIVVWINDPYRIVPIRFIGCRATWSLISAVAMASLEVLNRKRPLTLRMVWRLHTRLGIPAKSLIKV